jgi:spore maturation protein CgeB
MKLNIILFAEKGRNNIDLKAFYESAFKELNMNVRQVFYSINTNFIRLSSRVPTFYKYAQNKVSFDINEVINFNPDIIIIFKGIYINEKILRSFKMNTKAKIWNIYTDNPLANPGQKLLYNFSKKIELYDTIFTFSNSLKSVFYQFGAKDVQYLPFGYCKKTHLIKYSKNDVIFDVAYFGTWGLFQENWLTLLLNYKLGIFGTSWNRLLKKSPLTPFYIKGQGLGVEMNECIYRSKIIFNMVRAEHGALQTMKTFEIPACGGMMLTNRTCDQELFFKDGHDVVFYDSKQDMLKKIKYYLNNEDERDRIASNGYRTVQKHSYTNRALKLIMYYEDGKDICYEL